MKRWTISIAFATLLAACTSGGQEGVTSPSGAGQDGSPSQHPDPRHGPLGLAIVGLDGGVRQELDLPADAWMADLSPDGAQVMFLTGSINVGFCGGCFPRDRLAAVRVGRSYGRFIYLGAGPIRVEEPAWSPDGRQIAFVGVRGGNRDIYVANLSDHTDVAVGPMRRLTFSPAVDEFPAWSPDGSTIFYDNSGSEGLDGSGFSRTQDIWSVAADGGHPRRLTHGGGADVQPDVAPDGTVAFWREGDIWSMDQRGNGQHPLEAVPSGIGFDPRWSPDGTKMALLRYDSSGRATFDPQPGRQTDLPLLQVVVVDLATGEVATIGPRVASDVNPVSWTPDGSGLLVDRYDAGA